MIISFKCWNLPPKFWTFNLLTTSHKVADYNYCWLFWCNLLQGKYQHQSFLKISKNIIKSFIFHTLVTTLLHDLFVLYPPINPTALSTVPLVVPVRCNLCLLSWVSLQVQELHHHMGMRVPELSSVLATGVNCKDLWISFYYG